ncbi:MAG TPA: dTMP kinase [Candidatus Latescibacteria bacterium]|nr:dTMP kinase [Candidatus Latescibacterota bacterium]HJP33780.1 dTMP kinase [Candidatus Latescibacterota bacterium]
MSGLKPLFIVFEGVDGAGTTTQCDRLCERLRLDNHEIVQTREPGGTESGERIRELVLDPALKDLDDLAELLLYGAGRRQHVAEVIEPALAAGKPVISDRYAQSSIAYQGAARGLGSEVVDQVNHLATGGLSADFVMYLDLSVDIALQRRQKRCTTEDRLEQAGVDFQAAVRQAYLELAAAEPEHSLLVDAAASVEDQAVHVHQTLLARFPQFPYRISDP